ncbi:uncharacterized protein [Asterias amurensis]|uniref:uncharacterized protein n=1 Tax=Asterias amurensis TaxID=7602 RepID=UPI003AB65427
MANSDDEDVLFSSSRSLSNQQGKGLLGNKVKTIDDIMNGPKEDRRLKKTLALCASFLVLGLSIAVVGPTLLALQKHLSVEFPKMSYVFIGRSSGYLIGSVMGGVMFDYINTALLIGLTLLVSGIGMLLAPFCLQLWNLCAVMSAVGLAMGALDTGANVFCLRLWGKRSPPFLQALHFSFALGAFISPLLASPFIEVGNLTSTSLALEHSGGLSTTTPQLDSMSTTVLLEATSEDSLPPATSPESTDLPEETTESSAREPKSPEKEPETPEKEPESPEKEPESPEKEPETPEKEPGTPEKEPGTPEKEPESPKKEPETPEKKPESPAKEPETPEKEPETNEKEPQSPEKEPETNEKEPQSPEKETETPEKEPESPEKEPETPEKEPEPPEKEPESPEKEPESPEKEPESPEKELETPEKEPGTPAKEPETPEKEPETNEKEPQSPEKETETPEKEPESPEKEPETPEKEPESPEKEPESPEKEPESPEKEPESPEKEPETPEKEPETPAKEPETPEKEPETNEKEPESPEKETETPEKEPESPEKEPETPEKEPETPEKEPESPEKEPETPEKEPESPEKEPETPEKEPESPGKEQETPEKEPESPEKEPETPEKEPGTPEKEPESPEKEPRSPEKEPETPEKEPESPEKEPETPEKEPETPEKEPESPAKEPETPEKEPDTNEKEPQSPEKEPETPEKELESPKKEPETPEKEPETPEKEPETPEKEPESPAKEPESPAKKTETPEKEPKTPEKEPETPGAADGHKRLRRNASKVNEPEDSLGTKISSLHNPASSQFQNVYIIIGIFTILVSCSFFYFYCTSPVKPQPGPKSEEDNESYTDFKNTILFLMFLFYFLEVGAEIGFGGYIFTFARVSDLNFSVSSATLLNAAFFGAFAIGRGLSICLAGALSARVMLIMDVTGGVLASLVLTLYGETVPIAVWVGTALLGLSMASLFPAGISWLESYCKVTGNMASILIIGSALGEMCFPMMIGWLFGKDPNHPEGIEQGPIGLMYIILAASCLTAILFVILQYLAKQNGVEYKEIPIAPNGIQDMLQGFEESFVMEELGPKKATKQISKPIIPKAIQVKKHRE